MHNAGHVVTHTRQRVVGQFQPQVVQTGHLLFIQLTVLIPAWQCPDIAAAGGTGEPCGQASTVKPDLVMAPSAHHGGNMWAASRYSWPTPPSTRCMTAILKCREHFNLPEGDVTLLLQPVEGRLAGANKTDVSAVPVKAVRGPVPHRLNLRELLDLRAT